MMARTDRHLRLILRRLTRHTLLYTEMLTTGAIDHGDRDSLLRYNQEEHPIALQVGGDDPAALARAARVAEEWGYDEINVNVGCPSDRVQRGSFGACLMKRPELVAEGVAAMRGACSLPVTVKHRIGVDELDRYEDMHRFVVTVAAAGADRFTVHARKAWLEGLSPKENRTVPPLRYDDVHRLKREHPELVIEINGGFRVLEAARLELDHVDAVMIGRYAYEEPAAFAHADRIFFDSDEPPPDARDVVVSLLPYIEEERSGGTRLYAIARHLLPMFNRMPGARAFRRVISEKGVRPDAGPEVLLEALSCLRGSPGPQGQSCSTRRETSRSNDSERAAMAQASAQASTSSKP